MCVLQKDREPRLKSSLFIQLKKKLAGIHPWPTVSQKKFTNRFSQSQLSFRAKHIPKWVLEEEVDSVVIEVGVEVAEEAALAEVEEVAIGEISTTLKAS